MRRALSLVFLISIGGGCSFQENEPSPWELRVEAERQAQEAYRQSYVQGHPELSEQQKDAILSERTWIGMTAEQCEASLGKPYRINVTGTVNGRSEQWVYRLCYDGPCVPQALYSSARCAYLYFEHGRLTASQN